MLSNFCTITNLHASLVCRSTIQIKSHAEKILSKLDDGIDVLGVCSKLQQTDMPRQVSDTEDDIIVPTIEDASIKNTKSNLLRRPSKKRPARSLMNDSTETDEFNSCDDHFMSFDTLDFNAVWVLCAMNKPPTTVAVDESPAFMEL